MRVPVQSVGVKGPPEFALGIRPHYGRGAIAPLELAVYGRYCGPDYGDPTGCTAPVDQVDAVCCRHDVCYGENGYFDCGCDCQLVEAMPSAIADTSSAQGKAAGTAAMIFFANSPCVTRAEVCIPVVGCVTVPIPNPGGPSKCLLS
jgi:hypothetical protein